MNSSAGHNARLVLLVGNSELHCPQFKIAGDPRSFFRVERFLRAISTNHSIGCDRTDNIVVSVQVTPVGSRHFLQQIISGEITETFATHVDIHSHILQFDQFESHHITRFPLNSVIERMSFELFKIIAGIYYLWPIDLDGM